MNLFLYFDRIMDKITWKTTAFLYTLNLETFLSKFQHEWRFLQLSFGARRRNKNNNSKTYCISLQLWKICNELLAFFFYRWLRKIDLHANRSSKYLLYQFNDCIESSKGTEKLIIWHTAKAKDSVSLKTIENRDRQFSIEKLIHGVEFNNP